ncbi:MAG: hypothetical protein AB8B92_01565 [Gammaproteobacteria bacterium]
MSDEIEKLDGQDTGILNKQGWHFIVRYKSKDGSTGSNAHNHALEKALSIEQPTGIRMLEEGEQTIFEVWEYWK